MEKKDIAFKIQNAFFITTLALIGLGIVLFFLGYLNSQSQDQIIPLAMFEVARILYYYHIVHFVAGIGILIFLIRKIKAGLTIKIVKTILGLVFTPFSFMLMLTAMLLIGLSSCSS